MWCGTEWQHFPYNSVKLTVWKRHRRFVFPRTASEWSIFYDWLMDHDHFKDAAKLRPLLFQDQKVTA